jgi:hypothetical protein
MPWESVGLCILPLPAVLLIVGPSIGVSALSAGGTHALLGHEREHARADEQAFACSLFDGAWKFERPVNCSRGWLIN